MRPRCTTVRQMPKDSEIRFRCDNEMRLRFERIAAMERRNASDLGRLIFEDYVATQEIKLGLTKPKFSYGHHQPSPLAFPESPGAQPPPSSNQKIDAAAGEMAAQGVASVLKRHDAANVSPTAKTSRKAGPGRQPRKPRSSS